MHRPFALRVGTIATLVALVCVTTACSTDTDAHSASDNPGETAPKEALEAQEDGSSGAEPDGNDERAFDASDDDVILTVESTFKSDNARASWDGSTLRVSMDGSADAPTASIPCLAIEALIADGEEVTLVFSDGELICADRASAH